MGLDSNQRTLARTELQSVAINHSATHPRVELAGCIKKGFVPNCQVCDDIFMTKPPGKRHGKAYPPRKSGKEGARPIKDAGRFKAEPRRPARKDGPQKPAAQTAPKVKIKADLFGLHAVREAWNNPKRYVHALFVTENGLREFEPFLKTATKRPEPTVVSKEELDRAFPAGTVHQGIALSCQPLAEESIMDIIIRAENKPKSVILILDQVTDPHNVGAILRSACAFGADGLVLQSRHAPDMTGILAKIACGALEHTPIAYETNLSRAIEKLKEHHYTIIGLDEHAPKKFGDLYAYDRVVMILGAEGPGMRRLIKEHCDVLVTLPTQPPIASLNVSNAAAIALYALTA